MNAIKTAECKRCGSTCVAWVKSKKTGKFYLAFAVQASYREDGVIYPQTVHKCDDPQRGGFKACELCGKHHYTPFGLTNPTYCTKEA